MHSEVVPQPEIFDYVNLESRILSALIDPASACVLLHGTGFLILDPECILSVKRA